MVLINKLGPEPILQTLVSDWLEQFLEDNEYNLETLSKQDELHEKKHSYLIYKDSKFYFLSYFMDVTGGSWDEGIPNRYCFVYTFSLLKSKQIESAKKEIIELDDTSDFDLEISYFEDNYPPLTEEEWKEGVMRLSGEEDWCDKIYSAEYTEKSEIEIDKKVDDRLLNVIVESLSDRID